MTPAQLIDDLKLPQDQVDRIKALEASFEEFEDILTGGDKGKCPPSPLHNGLRQQTDNCISLIAKVLNEDTNTVQQTLLSLFGITERQFLTTSRPTLLIVAFSALVDAKHS